MAEYVCTVSNIVLFSCVFVIVVSLLDLVRVGWMKIAVNQCRFMRSMLIKAGWKKAS